MSMTPVGKAAAYTVLVDGFAAASGDGVPVKFPKGPASPRNEYEETLLKAGVEGGYVKAPASETPEEE